MPYDALPPPAPAPSLGVSVRRKTPEHSGTTSWRAKWKGDEPPKRKLDKVRLNLPRNQT